MRNSLFILLFLLCSMSISAQTTIPGRVINRENRKPLAYAQIQTSDGRQILTNIDGSFELPLTKDTLRISISYVGFKSLTTLVHRSTRYLQIGLTPSFEQLNTVLISSGPNPADEIVKRAIARREQNDPEKALEGFSYNSYSKFIIDNEYSQIELTADSTSATIETIIDEGRAYLSEKVSEHLFVRNKGSKEKVTGIKTAGFEEPVYNVLAMEVNPLSLYKKDYQLYKTEYAGPLAKNALNNYEYRILDTTSTARPAYMVYFKPRREKVVAGLEGILYLDTLSLAIQKAKAQLLGAVKLEVVHDYKYYPEKDIWFPSEQTTTIRPGSGGKEIAVFGGTISVGAVQQKKGILSTIFGSKQISGDLYLTSTTRNSDINLDFRGEISNPGAEIDVTAIAPERDSVFWASNRQIEFNIRDKATREKVDSLIKVGNVKRKLQVKNAIASGSYPLGFWDLDLSKIFKFNNYEGIRLGFGGKTNDRVSEKFNLKGYTTYGFKDEVVKYGIGTQIYLNKRKGTNLNFFFSRDIQEIASFDYLKGQNTFSILEPRFVNINYFYNYRTYWTSLEHRLSPKLNTELRLGREEIWQIQDYSYLKNNNAYRDYELSTATLSFLWQPFSKFLSTPGKTILLEKNFPQFTGQIQQSVAAFDGDFNFTRIGLKAEHEIKRLDQSRTEFILEGNYGFGDLPLTHAFHAYPNNPNRSNIFRRFSVAGRNSFETMYFNEFYSNRQAMLHIRHQLRPFRISDSFQPEFVFISRHAIGDFTDISDHQNINFNTLEHGYSEAGMELNKIFAGFGLSAAYRYGAYHLPTFKQNFSFKFTLQLQL
ncbi:DUF5686 and carboxypeptidase regulatory-like domain-containing protein [Gramella jeungdoensis]|uniref:DUF5686 and carboxypeptidase regulatory-like domain-containing protein n=1 Tax=Gramella jeungdoensis TaxID=708091 RepID=A0ABT0YYZ4_9FLAO|nr:DUF5686 family protein [Gramella jeungdoensis]MCM8568696.1 DUF5686 and carboxypeptidase regulatory-like domain-containing protein [Gramella jeungdoensis]